MIGLRLADFFQLLGIKKNKSAFKSALRVIPSVDTVVPPIRQVRPMIVYGNVRMLMGMKCLELVLPLMPIK